MRECGFDFWFSQIKDAFGVNSKIGVQPGAYDSEACAFACEHMNGLLK